MGACFTTPTPEETHVVVKPPAETAKHRYVYGELHVDGAEIWSILRAYFALALFLRGGKLTSVFLAFMIIKATHFEKQMWKIWEDLQESEDQALEFEHIQQIIQKLFLLILAKASLIKSKFAVSCTVGVHLGETAFEWLENYFIRGSEMEHTWGKALVQIGCTVLTLYFAFAQPMVAVATSIAYHASEDFLTASSYFILDPLADIIKVKRLSEDKTNLHYFQVVVVALAVAGQINLEGAAVYGGDDFFYPIFALNTIFKGLFDSF
jgi:hypothetical protein